ncbi:MAG: urease accessory protein UreD [Nocardioidaceae bacterium]
MSDREATRVAVDVVDGRVRLTDLVAGVYLRPRPLAHHGTLARVALVGAYATLLAGDDLRLEIAVGPGAQLELVEPSGTIAYDARGGSARWSATVDVAAGGTLVWDAAPFVVAHGADVHRCTRAVLDEGAAMLLRETLVLGRESESTGGRLYSSLHATYRGRPLLVEDLDVRDPAHRGSPGILGDNRVLATAAILGARPDSSSSPHETPLAGPGSLARVLAPHAHLALAALADTWQRWHETLSQPDTANRG